MKSQKSLLLAGVLLLAFVNEAGAASQFCKNLHNGFHDELDKVVKEFRRMAGENPTKAQVCDFETNALLPLNRSILARAEKTRDECGEAAVSLARTQLQNTEAEHAADCSSVK
jgi:hypothetical protein